jgi:hypothetical protein
METRVVPIFIHTPGNIDQLRRLRAQFAEALAECKQACAVALAQKPSERLRRAAPTDPFLLFDAHALRHQSHIILAAVAVAIAPARALIMEEHVSLRATPAALAALLRSLQSDAADWTDLAPAAVDAAPQRARPEALDERHGIWAVPVAARPPHGLPAAFSMHPRFAHAYAALARNPYARVPPFSKRAIFPAPLGPAHAEADERMKRAIYRDVICHQLTRPCRLVDPDSGKELAAQDIMVISTFGRADAHKDTCGLIYLCPEHMDEAERRERANKCMYAAARMKVASVCINICTEGDTHVRVAVAEAGGHAPSDQQLARHGYMTHTSALRNSLRVMVIPIFHNTHSV